MCRPVQSAGIQCVCGMMVKTASTHEVGIPASYVTNYADTYQMSGGYIDTCIPLFEWLVL